jgi:hypothetical protein
MTVKSLSIISLLLFVVACKKKEVDPALPDKRYRWGKDTWVIDDVIYNKTGSKWNVYNTIRDTINQIVFSEPSLTHSMSLAFRKKPTASGYYKVVEKPANEDEVSIHVRHNGHDPDSFDLPSYKVKVTNVDGRLSFGIYKVPLVYPTMLFGNHEVTCSFYLTE